MIKLKLFFLIKIFILFLIINFKSFAGDLKEYENAVFIGPYDAKVKIKIFSSLTCPHCANFHNKVVPEIKKKYIDSGSVQLIFIDFPLDQAAFNASKLLHCLEQKKQIKFLDTIYENQAKWTSGTNINEINNNLKIIVKDFGINSAKFNTCLVDDIISDKILNGRIEAGKKYEITSTPTIIINEEKFNGSPDFKNIKKEIEKII
ncbi:DsbA family protein [Pelagibacteraceae bacterium]|nr:DsbA family protein [Pelagibacteraceae bacterium]